jgi:hypothetical protein
MKDNFEHHDQYFLPSNEESEKITNNNLTEPIVQFIDIRSQDRPLQDLMQTVSLTLRLSQPSVYDEKTAVAS